MQKELFVIDDFTGVEGHSRLGTVWQGFTDRVMGGHSDMRAGLVEDHGVRALLMTGDVSLDNDGGFIQVRLPMSTDERPFNASTYAGLLLSVRGTPGQYAVHLRTSDNAVPWSYYEAPLPVSDEWTITRIGFSAFEGVFIDQPLNLAHLESIALFAGAEEFHAELWIKRLALCPYDGSGHCMENCL